LVEASFAQTMQRAGTVPLGPAPARVPPPAPQPKNRVRVATPPGFHLAQNEEWIEGYRDGLSPRDRRRIKGPLAATLDLHGHDSKSALRALSEFLARERGLGRERVLVIVGKGQRTPGGSGILRASIADWLSAAPLADHVLAFGSAAPSQGGTGAVVVLLAPRRRAKKD
jgi:DNA-nicking Smr family endonuclease